MFPTALSIRNGDIDVHVCIVGRLFYSVEIEANFYCAQRSIIRPLASTSHCDSCASCVYKCSDSS